MRKLIFLALILFAFLNVPQTIFAQEYVVQPILLIPSDWNSRATPEIVENQYKPNILQALKEVQLWYASRLNGHTFKYVNKVDVRRLNKEAGDTSYIPQTLSGYENNRSSWDVYLKLGGPNELIFYGTDVVENYWMVGSENLVEWGGYVWQGNDTDKKFRAAVMDHSNLLKLNPDRDSRQRNDALGILAHELGHSFDLVQAGKAKWHPCTQSHQKECNGGAPFPSDAEWEQNVMGAWWNYPDNGFTNTPSNPVIQKAYNSLFLNPNKDPGPTPDNNPPKLPLPQINAVSPKALSKQPYHTSTYYISVTCGEENTPIPNITAKFYQLGYPNVAGFVTTDETGRSSFKYNYVSEEETRAYYIFEMPLKIIYGVPKPPLYSFQANDFNKYDNYTFSFHYPQCLQKITTPIPSPIESPSPTPEVETKQDNTPSQIIISNDPDFAERKNAQDEVVADTEVIENPNQTKEVPYTPPQDGNSDTTYIRVG